MLRITIPPLQMWDEEKEEFVYGQDTVIQLEHSLASLSKWEAKWHKPFLEKKDKTAEETIDYIRCMTLTQNVDPEVYKRIDEKLVKEITDYIEDPSTATWFNERDKPKASKRIITAEIIYYQMIALNIPFECQNWHLNRLLTLIRVCDEESAPQKKKSRRQILEEQMALNRKRRAAQKARRKR